MLSVGVGVAALIVALSVLNGFNQSLQKKLLASEAHLVVEFENSSDLQLLGNESFSEPFVSAEAFERQDVLLRSYDGAFSGAEAIGLDTLALQNLLAHKAGDFQVDQHMQPGDIIVPLELAQSLGLFEGDSISLLPAHSLLLPVSAWPHFARLRVRKIKASTETGLEHLKIYYHKKQSAPFFSNNPFARRGLQFQLRDPYKLQQAQRLLNQKLRAVGVNKYQLQSWRDRNSTLFLALKLEKYVMTLFLALSVLITSFSIVTLVVLLKARKQRDMGVMMALGWSPQQVQSVFSQVGFGVFMGAALGGLLVGTGLAYALHFWPLEILPDIYYERHLPSKPSLQLIASTAVGCSLLGFVTAYIPSWFYFHPRSNLF